VWQQSCAVIAYFTGNQDLRELEDGLIARCMASVAESSPRPVGEVRRSYNKH
jgi:hypothetical protein